MEKKSDNEKNVPQQEAKSQLTVCTVPPVLFSKINEYVTLSAIARNCQLSEEVLLEQIRLKKLPALQMGASWLVRMDQFEQFLELYRQEKALDEYMAAIEAKQKRVEKAIAALRQQKESLKAVADKEVVFEPEAGLAIQKTGIYAWILKELSVLIPNERKREVFIDISLGKKVQYLAVVWDVTENTIRADYKDAVEILKHKFGFLKHYRKLMSELYYELRTQELTIRKFQKEINTVLELLALKHIGCQPDLKKKPVAVINMLSASLERLNLEGVTLLGFHRKDIYTLEDLLWHISSHGVDSILEFDRTGKGTLQQLKYKLMELGIINKDGEILLFKKEE